MPWPNLATVVLLPIAMPVLLLSVQVFKGGLSKAGMEEGIQLR